MILQRALYAQEMSLKSEPGFDIYDDLNDGKPRQPSGGATDMFATIPSEAKKPDADLAETLPSVPAAGPRPTQPPQPVVHEVVFKDNPSSRDGSDALLNLLRSAPAPRPPAEAAPAVSPAPVQSSSAGFTQLLRALTVEQTRPEPAKPADPVKIAPVAAIPPTSAAADTVPAPAAAQTITQLFREMDQPATSSGAEPKQTQEAPQVAPAASAAPAPSSPPGSFTQLFSTLSAGSSTPTQEPVIAPARTPAAEPVITEPQQTATPAQAGSFTQLFQVLDAPPAVEAKHEEKFVPPVETRAPEPEPATAGSFTQLFSTLGESQTPAAPRASQPFIPPATEPPAPQPGPSAPGSFTQLFSSLGDSATPRPAHPSPEPFAQPTASASPDRATQTPPSSSGSFTQLFKTLDEPQKPEDGTTPPRQGGDFYAPSKPADVPPPLRPAADSSDSGLGASQIFSAYTPPPEKKSEASLPPFAANSGYGETARPPQPAAPESGGLTQLLRMLDQPGTPVNQSAPAVAPPVALPQAASFTSAYETLNSASPPIPGPPSPKPSPAITAPIPSPISAPSGPSEYTRILNASALREAGIRAGTSAAPQAPVVQATPGAATAAAPQITVPKLPEAPSLPQVKAPEAPAPNKMQQYLPLLLVIIIFLLVIILVTVVFMLKH